MFKKVKGTHDYLDLSLFNFLISKVKKHLNIYNFIEISTPILEYTELFKRSLGQETDVVSKEMFIIESRLESQDSNSTDNKEGSICLRPEATASTVRAFVNSNVDLTPWKVYSYGPMFRYERPQKGRARQFHQVNIEVIGSESIFEDAQLIKMLERLFQDDLCLDNYALLINFLGCRQDRESFKVILNTFLEKHISALCDKCVVRKEKNILRVFDCKNSTCQDLYKSAPYIADNLCIQCSQEWQQLQNELEQLSVSFSYSPTLVRGLDYYEKTVFEFVSDDLGAQSAFCGGGRYNQLAKDIGAKQDQPSIGAAMGIERLLILLETIKDQLNLPELSPLSLILPLDKEQNSIALLLADELQANCLRTDVLLSDASVKSKMRKANKMNARFVILIGKEEQENKQVTLKDMQTGESQIIKQFDLVKLLKSL